MIPALHYGLKPGGLLILGSAESIGARSDLFDVLDSENKILVKKIASSHAGNFAWQSPIEPSHPANNAAADAAGEVPSVANVETRASRILRDLYAPPGVIIDDQMQVLSFHGETDFYLEHTPDVVRSHLLQLAREGLVYPLRRLVGSAIQRSEPMSRGTRACRVRQPGKRDLNSCDPHCHGACPLFCRIVRTGRPSSQAPTPALHPPVSGQPTGALESQLEQAQRELSDLRLYLRKIVEQHEAANEELKSANEGGAFLQ